MNRRESRPGDGPPASEPPDDDELDETFGVQDIEASLNDALSDLERMLERHGDSEHGPGSGASGPEHEGESYTIPLLDEVVIPGPGVAEFPPDPAHLAAQTEHPAQDEATRRLRLATRLASEIEVIVQDRLEEAMERARDEIREQVRNHMDIILPEIVEEMLQHRVRDQD